MEKELYYTNNKLISKLNIYFDVNPSQFNDKIITKIKSQSKSSKQTYGKESNQIFYLYRRNINESQSF